MLSKFFSEFFETDLKRRKRRKLSKQNVAKIKDLGFDVLDLRGWHDGRFYTRRYHIVDTDGTVYQDEDHNGFKSTRDCLREAKAVRARQARTQQVV